MAYISTGAHTLSVRAPPSLIQVNYGWLIRAGICRSGRILAVLALAQMHLTWIKAEILRTSDYLK
jgi:hypothetical protein